VATDGDGTLWSGDVGDDVFHAMLDRGELRAAAVETIANVASQHGVSASGEGKAVLQRVYEAYRSGAFDERSMYELMAIAFGGWTRDEVRTFVCDVLEREGLARRIHAELAHLVAWFKAEGLRVVLVSASPRYVVEEAAAFAGIDRRDVVAVTPHWKDDVMLTDVERPIPYADGKVSGLRRHAGDAPLIAAFGDNAFDFAMLAESAVPIAIRPKQRLLDRAADLPRLVRLAEE